MKKLAAIVLSLILILSLFACSTTGDTTQELKDITVCLDWTPNTNHTGMYVALEKGFYKDAGLNVSIVQPPENGAVLMCASGEAQFAVDAQDTMAASLATDKPLGVTAVSAILQHNTSGIISRKGEGMDRPAGLTGKTYSTWEIPTELAILRQLVNADGGNWDDVRLIPNTITDEAGALKHKDTDAVWIFYGWSGINAELSGLEFDYFAFADLDPVFDYYTPVIIANNDFLANDPETAKKFLAATAKGYDFAAENPDEAAEMLIKGDTTGSLAGSEELVRASQKWISAQYKADAESWGRFDAKRWDAFYAWLWDNELISVELPAGTGFSNDYLPE